MLQTSKLVLASTIDTTMMPLPRMTDKARKLVLAKVAVHSAKNARA